jgi:uncharacterized protein (DUF2267 family)
MQHNGNPAELSCAKTAGQSEVTEGTDMQMNEFVGHVQHDARLSDMDQALNATRATLETLAERLGADESRHLAAQLPQEIGQYLGGREAVAEHFSSDEFLKRISAREGVEPPDSVDHARAVLNTLQQAVSAGEMRDVLGRLSADYARLFAGTTGKRRSYGAGF